VISDVYRKSRDIIIKNPFLFKRFRHAVATAYRDEYTDTAGGGKLLSWKYYPLENYKHDVVKTNLNELYANVGITYKFTPALNAEIKYQYQ
jgi:TonB-dependent starch-binding outer membrane protein SusC